MCKWVFVWSHWERSSSGQPQLSGDEMWKCFQMVEETWIDKKIRHITYNFLQLKFLKNILGARTVISDNHNKNTVCDFSISSSLVQFWNIASFISQIRRPTSLFSGVNDTNMPVTREERYLMSRHSVWAVYTHHLEEFALCGGSENHLRLESWVEVETIHCHCASSTVDTHVQNRKTCC